jgi:hypothetical protein
MVLSRVTARRAQMHSLGLVDGGVPTCNECIQPAPNRSILVKEEDRSPAEWEFIIRDIVSSLFLVMPAWPHRDKFGVAFDIVEIERW